MSEEQVLRQIELDKRQRLSLPDHCGFVTAAVEALLELDAETRLWVLSRFCRRCGRYLKPNEECRCPEQKSS